MSRSLRPTAVLVAAAALAAAALPAAASPGRAAKKSPCFGKAPTIFSSANGVHLKGTGKADVIEATGKNVTVTGGAGNDRICVNSAKKVDGGAGDDRIQLRSGTVTGGTGHDTIQVLSGTGNVKIDGGAGPNTFIVPTSRLLHTTITYHPGDVINGVTARIDAPAGAPSFDIGYDGRSSSPLYETENQPYSNFNPLGGPSLEFYKALAANGRTLAHWAVTWGDGSPNAGGNGGPPNYAAHRFLTTGPHTIVASVTDNLGVTTVRTQVVDVAYYSTVTLTPTAPPIPVTTAAKTFTVTTSYGTGAHPFEWFASFGDGTVQSGAGAAPATLSHTYSQPGSYEVTIDVLDDHGDEAEDDTNSTYAPAAGPYTAMTLYEYNQVLVPYARSIPEFTQEIVPGATVYSDSEVEFNNNGYGDAHVTKIDWGDGTQNPTNQTYHYYYANAPVTRTITVSWAMANGTALPSTTRTLTVLPTPGHANLATTSNLVPEGPVTFSTAGTVLPPAGTYAWEIYFSDGSVPLYGYGAPPATFTHVFPSGQDYAELYISPVNADEDNAYDSFTATSPAPRVAYFGGYENGDWVPALVSSDASSGNAVYFSGSVIPSTGSHMKSATIAFGDGSSLAVPAFGDGNFGSTDDARHAYTVAGEYVATLTAKDATNKVAVDRNHVSVAGFPTTTVPATLTATHGVAVSLPVTASAGANAGFAGYDITWGDPVNPGHPDTFAYGAPPAGPTHTYNAPGTYTVIVNVYNDHGGFTRTRTTVTVA